MKAIITEFVAATDTKGTYCRAYDESGFSHTITWNSSLDYFNNHKNACIAFIKQIGWPLDIPLYGGHIKHGMVWVFEDEELKINLKEEEVKS